MNQAHGSPFDRGSADSFYRRQAIPHYMIDGARIEQADMTAQQIAEYEAGFLDNEKQTDILNEAYSGNKSDFQYDLDMALDRMGLPSKVIKSVKKVGKGYEVRMSSYMSQKDTWEKIGKELGANLIDFKKGSINIGLYESVEINEASKVVSIANVVRDMLPKEFFYAWKSEDKEKLKAVISDLVKALNRFYKQHNIKVRFTDTDYKYVMYAKEIVEAELHEILNNPLNEDLRNWFGKGKSGSKDGGGWDRYNSEGEKVGKCGDAKEGEPYAACLSQEKAKKLGKDGIASFVRRKRAAQKKSGDAKKGGEQKKGQKPTFVKTGA